MGAGASMDPMTAAAPYPTVAAALADGKSQGDIDAFLAVSPAAARATRCYFVPCVCVYHLQKAHSHASHDDQVPGTG